MTQEACSTPDTAFVDYGIESGEDLMRDLYDALRETERRRVEISPALMDKVTRLFRDQFVEAADLPVVPEPVEAAIPDARAQTIHELLDSRTVSLRREVLPTFYRALARLSCGYRSYYPEGGFALEFEE